MTPYILFLMVSVSYGPTWAQAPAVIDMPSAAICREALRNWTTPGLFGKGIGVGVPGFYDGNVRGWCLTRDGKAAP